MLRFSESQLSKNQSMKSSFNTLDVKVQRMVAERYRREFGSFNTLDVKVQRAEERFIIEQFYLFQYIRC